MDQVVARYPEVLRSILEYLEPKDLVSCRNLRNRAWNAEANHILQRRLTINFSSLEKLMAYCDTFKRSINPVSLRFQSFQFGKNLYYEEALDNIDGVFGPGVEPLEGLRRLTEAFKKFKEVSGDNVLRFSVPIAPTFYLSCGGVRRMHPLMVFVFEHLFKMVYESYPKLESFNLSVERKVRREPYYDGDDDDEDYDYEDELAPELSDADHKQSVEEIGGNFPRRELPNLKEITLERLEESYRTEDDAAQSWKDLFSKFMVSLLSSAIKLDTMTSGSWWTTCANTEGFMANFAPLSSNLRSLIIKATLGDFDLGVITTHNFANLKIVDLTIGKDVTSDTLHDFLHRYRLFLQKLHLHIKFEDRNEPRLSPQLPPPGTVMRQLDLLVLEGYSNGTLVWRNLPKLQKLVLHRCSNLTRIDSNPSSPTRALETLEVNEFRSHGLPETETLSLIETDQFSFLTSLSIRFMAFPLSIIFERYKLLKHLAIVAVSGSPGLNTRTICGIPSHLLEAISPVGNLQRDSSPEVIETMIQMAKTLKREKPYIGDLVGLQSLTLNGNLSDSSVLFGIAQCEQLRRVALTSFPPQFTWRAKLILERGLKHLDKAMVAMPEFANTG